MPSGAGIVGERGEGVYTRHASHIKCEKLSLLTVRNRRRCETNREFYFHSSKKVFSYWICVVKRLSHFFKSLIYRLGARESTWPFSNEVVLKQYIPEVSVEVEAYWEFWRSCRVFLMCNTIN